MTLRVFWLYNRLIKPFVNYGSVEILHFNGLCENSVHASRTSARTGCGVRNIKYLTVRPEPSRRAPIEFSHSLSFRMTSLLISRLRQSLNAARAIFPHYIQCYLIERI